MTYKKTEFKYKEFVVVLDTPLVWERMDFYRIHMSKGDWYSADLIKPGEPLSTWKKVIKQMEENLRSK